MELALACFIILLLVCLRPAFNNRWLRSDPGSRLGLSIALGTWSACGCGCIYLLFLAVRNLTAYLTA